MTAEDVASDLEASGLATAVHEALVSAYDQGAAYVRGQLDSVQAMYDNACAEWDLACRTGADLAAAFPAYQSALMVCAHEWGRIVGHENIPDQETI